MDNEINNKNEYSIDRISNDKCSLIVPIYQRLFAWREEQVNTILCDIYKRYTESNGNSKYYIGMITIIKNNDNWELVDGQQRMTFLYLLLIYLDLKIKDIKGIEEIESLKGTIKKFCTINDNDDKVRLKFSCRENDNEYIKSLYLSNNVESALDIKNKYYNEKMNKAIVTINKFFNNKKDDEAFLKNFSIYICKNVVFFVSNLPEVYEKSPKLLNKYFERMNESGKNLENVEILKVNIVAKLARNDQKKYLEIWNKISDFDKLFFTKKEKEDIEVNRKKYLDSIYSTSKCEYKNEENTNQSSDDFNKNLNEIDPVKHEFNKSSVNDDRTYRALIKFDEFLLLTLYSFYKEIFYDKNNSEEINNENNNDIVFTKIEIKVDDFFNTNNLLETFRKTLFNDEFNKEIDCFKNDEDRFKKFLDILLKYKLIFDYYFIRISTKNDNYDYTLDLLSENTDGKCYKSKYIMYMSMLYVASSINTYYKWIPDLLIFLYKSCGTKKTDNIINSQICAKDLYNKILEIDNKWHPIKDIESKNMTYEKIDRYWLWKIDYLLWENRENCFDKDDKEYKNVVDKYVFKRNRSIEHIEPQHPKDDSVIKWEEIENGNKKLNSLGNLAMISNGLNSSLSNSSINVKMAYVKDYIDKNKNGSIESLKLLWTYQKYNQLKNEHCEEEYVKNIEEYERLFIELLKNNKGSANI